MRRRRTHARENPLPLLPLLIIAGAAAVAGGGAYYLAKKGTSVPLLGSSKVPPGPYQIPLAMTQGETYIIAANGIPATITSAESVIAAYAQQGFEQIAVLQYRGKGVLPFGIASVPNGMVLAGVWAGPSGRPTPAGAAAFNAGSNRTTVHVGPSAVVYSTGAAPQAVTPIVGITPNAPSTPGTVSTSGNAASTVNGAVNQGKAAVSTAQNVATQAQNTAGQLSNFANSFGGDSGSSDSGSSDDSGGDSGDSG
jgi:hypothetical protein